MRLCKTQPSSSHDIVHFHPNFRLLRTAWQRGPSQYGDTRHECGFYICYEYRLKASRMLKVHCNRWQDGDAMFISLTVTLPSMLEQWRALTLLKQEYVKRWYQSRCCGTLPLILGEINKKLSVRQFSCMVSKTTT